MTASAIGGSRPSHGSCSFAVYVAVGYWLQVRHGFILGDALSRVSAAQSVLFSRSPHLAAIGFIFTPLTAMVQIPVIAASPLFPALAARAFAGSIMSAGFMAGAVVQILSMGTDRGLPRRYVVTIAVLFAVNPMVVFYGSNGMSEAPFIFFISWAVRRLIMWMVDDDVHHLVIAGGIAMGLAYLTRYDAVACVAAAGFLVGLTTYLRARRAPRFRRALLDLILVSAPGFVAFIGWAVASWLITGEAFAQFTSQYGNAAILKQSGAEHAGPVSGLVFAATCTLLLAPTLIPLGVWAGFIRWGRANWTVLIPPVAVYGAALAFQALTFAAGSTFPFLRFYIIAIPFAACLAMLAVPDGAFAKPKRRGRHAPAPSAPAVDAHSVRLRRGGVGAGHRCAGGRLGDEPAALRPAGVRPGRGAQPGTRQCQPAQGRRTPHRPDVLDRTHHRRLPRQPRPAAEFGDHRHGLRFRHRRRVAEPPDLRGAVGPRLRPAAEQPRRQRRQVPARRPADRPRCLRCAQPALSDALRHRCRCRHPGAGDTQ